jgi:hypothetical protein
MSIVEEDFNMKRINTLVGYVVILGLLFSARSSGQLSPNQTTAEGGGSKNLPDVIQLATGSKLGAVSFSHTNHTTKNRNIEGTASIGCIECHHTSQPASEVAKHPPLKTAWPPDRTTTLTLEDLKDPKTPNVIGCRSCHARSGETPKVLPAIPTMKSENSTAMITLTNQQAFHRECAGCHDHYDFTYESPALGFHGVPFLHNYRPLCIREAPNTPIYHTSLASPASMLPHVISLTLA